MQGIFSYALQRVETPFTAKCKLGDGKDILLQVVQAEKLANGPSRGSELKGARGMQVENRPCSGRKDRITWSYGWESLYHRFQ